MCQKKPLVVLTGPTAVGKTALSVALAKATDAEIISADSMQVYRHMDIGSAKITPAEMNGVPHHLIDVAEPEEPFSAAQFWQLSKEALTGIYERGHLPIVTGGTGFYIQALLYDIDFSGEAPDYALRKKLEDYAETQGNDALYAILQRIDPESCKVIHAHNEKRVIRAIEFYENTGMPISQYNAAQHQKESPYNFAYFVLTTKRERLYARIDARVDEMLANGLAEEVEALRNRGCTKDMVSMQGLGYKEILSYLDGACTLEEAVETIKRDSRHYAKRQLTWFRREKDVIWIQKEDFASDEAILQFILQKLDEKEIFRQK